MNSKLAPIVFSVILIAIVVSGTTLFKTGSDSRASADPPPDQIEKIENSIAKLETELEKQRQDFERFRQGFLTLIDADLLSGKKKSTTLDLTSKNYSKVDTSNGFFLVSCQDVQPYLDGYKIKLYLGNPLNARFGGVQILAGWGPRYSGELNDLKSLARWRAALRTKVFSFPQAVEPGRWNELELVLPKTAVSEIGHIEITVSTDTIDLGLPKQ